MPRQTGELALSIGTSMAIESIFNKSASVEQRQLVSQTTKIMISMATLFRNCLESHRKDDDYSANDLAAILAQEMELIDDLCKKQLSHKVEPLYYHALTDKFPKLYPHALWRDKNTERQRARMALTDEVLATVTREHGVVCGEYPDLSFNYGRYDKGIIITHLPHELLRFTDFPELALVESHTGAFKMRSAWYTKFSDGKTLMPMPFCLLTLAAFGDANTFKPQPAAKQVILNIAKQNKWRGDSSMKLVRESINRYHAKPGEDKSLVLRLLNMEK